MIVVNSKDIIAINLVTGQYVHAKKNSLMFVVRERNDFGMSHVIDEQGRLIAIDFAYFGYCKTIL